MEDSFESRMIPRVIESGRGMVEGFKEDEKGKRRASVLSSFHDNYSMCHA